MSSQKWLPPSFISPGEVPTASCFSGRLSKISTCIWPRLLSNYYLWAGTWSVWDFEHALSEQNLCFLQPSGSPVCKPHWPSKPDLIGTHLPEQCPWAGEPDVWLRPLLLGEKLCNCDYALVGHLPRCILIIPCFQSSYLSHCYFFPYVFSCMRSFLLVLRPFS